MIFAYDLKKINKVRKLHFFCICLQKTKQLAIRNKEEELHNSGSLHHNQNHSFGFKYKNRIASFLLMLQLNLNYFGLLFVLRKILGKQPTLKIFHLTHKIFFKILGNIINGCIFLH